MNIRDYQLLRLEINLSFYCCPYPLVHKGLKVSISGTVSRSIHYNDVVRIRSMP